MIAVDFVFAYELDSTWRGRDPPMLPLYLQELSGKVVISDVVWVSWHVPNSRAVDTKALSDLPKLTDLRLNVRQLTDDGLRPLSTLTRGLKCLEELKLRDTNVTTRGAAILQESLLNCRILGVEGWTSAATPPLGRARATERRRR